MSKMSKMGTYTNILNTMYIKAWVEDVEDRSNTPKGCNAMYVEGVEDIKYYE